MNWVSVLWRSRQFIPLFDILQTPYSNRLDQVVTFGSLTGHVGPGRQRQFYAQLGRRSN